MTLRGLFVPVSKDKEWLLRWWWLNYTLNSCLPVTFIQEGAVSKVCKRWCKERSSHQEFDETLWIEPWCQIRAPLDPLFLKTNCEALAATNHNINFDCVVFKKESPLLNNWHSKEDFFLKNSSKFNLFNFNEVHDYVWDLDQGSIILNWGRSLNTLKRDLRIAESRFLLKMSF